MPAFNALGSLGLGGLVLRYDRCGAFVGAGAVGKPQLCDAKWFCFEVLDFPDSVCGTDRPADDLGVLARG